MKRALREPLLHFLLLGAGLFITYRLVARPAVDMSGTIVVTRGQIASMVLGFSRTWQRPPTRDELDGLIRDRVREEVYCREALAIGLDRDDTIIRRRLRQKLEFVTDDIAALADPTDAELSSYLLAHPDSFRTGRTVTFRQVYLNPDKHGENLASDASQLLAYLNRVGSDAHATALGDSFLLEHQFAAAPEVEVAKQFGESFAAKLGALARGYWQGPVESGYGVYLVFVSERTEGRLPALAEVRNAVRREWENARRLEANEKFYQERLRRYTVTIEQAEPTAEQRELAAAK